MTSFLKNQFQNLRAGFWICLFAVCAFSLFSQYHVHASTLSLISALSGICFAFFAGEMRIVCYFFGLVYCLAYSIVAYEVKLYGDIFLNLIYLPLNILGLFSWYQHRNQEKIFLLSLNFKQHIWLGFVTLLLWLGYGFFLIKISAHYPMLNALSIILQILATYLQARRYVQNYLLVIVANLIMLWIWFDIFSRDFSHFLQFFNALIFLIISIFYYFRWQKEFKESA